MKILFLSWENFGTEDMKEAMIHEGHEVVMFKTSQEELLTPSVSGRISAAMKDNGCDILFGFNYFPYAAEAANKDGFDYYSWVYDNPSVQLYSCTAIYPTNHIFVFDSDTYLRFNSGGIDTISYLPMAAAPDRLTGLAHRSGSSAPGGSVSSDRRYDADIAFVGALYNEEHDFYSRMMKKGLPPYTEGFLRGIMEAQKQLYGVNIIEKELNERVLSDMHAALPLEPGPDSVITKETLFTEYVINRRITAEERRDMLAMLGRALEENPEGTADKNTARVCVYTRDGSVRIPGCVNRGPVDFYEEAPKVYASSRINLNISLRSIINGIPLRCFDIMGSGGFLLTSYAGDMLNFFTPDEDYVSFESPEDLKAKCLYYLSHEDERAAIAANGLARIKESHTFVHRVREMFA